MVRPKSAATKGKGKAIPGLPAQFDFSALLWKAVRATNPTAELISPVAFGILMTLVKVGARGVASDEISSTFRFNDDAATVQRYLKILKSLDGWKVDGILLTIFTTICGPAGATFHDDFVEFAEDNFKADIKTVLPGKQPQASKELNEKIASVTKNIITAVLKPADIGPKTNLMILSAVTFKGLYKNNYRFKAHQTKKEKFFNLNGSIADVDMMSGTADYFFGRLENHECTAIAIPYEGGNYSLTLVLPDTKNGIQQLEKQMDNDFFAIARSKIKRSSHVFTAKIPKFKVNCRVDLVAVLKSMGVTAMFDQKADFQGYFRNNGKGHFSKAYQQCALEVGEKGSEGGPPSAGVKLQSGEVKFEANRPFLFFITDEKNDIVIMLGCKYQF